MDFGPPLVQPTEIPVATTTVNARQEAETLTVMKIALAVFFGNLLTAAAAGLALFLYGILRSLFTLS